MSASRTTTANPAGPPLTLAPAPGVTPPPAAAEPGRFLTDVIVARGHVTQATMDAVVSESRSGQRKPEEVLSDRGAISEDDLARSLAERHRIDHLDLDVFSVDPEARSLIPGEVARRLDALPVAFLATGEVVVVLHDPEGSLAIAKIAALTGREVRPAMVSRTQLRALLDDDGRSQPAFAPVDATASTSADAEASAPAAAPATPPARLGPARDPLAEALGARAVESVEPTREAEEAAPAAGRPAEADLAGPGAFEAENRASRAERSADELRRKVSGLEYQLQAAEDRVKAAGAANDTLTRLVEAHEDSERDLARRGTDLVTLRSELDAERAERIRLEREATERPTDGDSSRALADLRQAVEREVAQLAASSDRLRRRLADPEASRVGSRAVAPAVDAPEPESEVEEVVAPEPEAVLIAPEPEPEPEVEVVGPEVEPEPEPEFQFYSPAPAPSTAAPETETSAPRPAAPSGQSVSSAPPGAATAEPGEASPEVRGFRRTIDALKRR